MRNTRICKFILLVFILCGIGLLTTNSFASEAKKLKGSITTSFFNEGAKIEIHWYIDKARNMKITSFTDNVNEAVIIVEGKHTTDFPVIKASYDENEILVNCQKTTITLDESNKIINIENNGGFMEFDTVKIDNKK